MEDKLSFYCFHRPLWSLWGRRTGWAVLALLALIGGLYLWQASQITATQRHIRQLRRERESWQRKNAQLREEIAELTQVATLTERARALGFAAPEKEVYLPLHEKDLPASAR
ncbi:MAG: septum formation initiator family protein [Chloroflexota bacterium]|nr:septum formation initiator family protein [Chloroflexota bacterium]